MLRRRIVLLAALVLFSGCAALFDKVRQPDMASRLSYQGFSFNRRRQQRAPLAPIRTYFLGTECGDSNRWCPSLLVAF